VSGAPYIDPQARAGLAQGSTGLGHIKHLLDQGLDVSILNWADSLSNGREDPREFIFRVADVIGTHPSKPSVNVQTWTGLEPLYGGATQEVVGTGPTVTIRNFSVPGAAMAYGLGSLWRDSGLADERPDVLFVCHGHNLVGASQIELVLGELLAGLEYFRLAHPGVPIVALVQNPAADTDAMTLAQKAWQRIASLRDVALIDGYSPYIAAGKPVDWYADADVIHPSDTGIEAAFLPSIKRIWARSPSRPAVALPSLLGGLDPALNLIPNGDFAEFDNAVPDGWVAETGVTAAKETAIVRNRGRGYSLKLTSTGGTAFANRINYTLPNGEHAPLRGKPISLFGWVYKPAGAPASLGQITLEALAPSGNSTFATTRAMNTQQTGAWVPWAICGLRVPDECFEITARLHHDTAASVASEPVYFQDVTLVRGPLPRGL